MTDLFVPIRDRRQRKRILTLKNFGRFAIAIAVVFAGLTLQSELRRGNTDGYGRLFGKQVAGQHEIAKPQFDVVKEVPVADQSKPDALLEEPAARSQYLIDDTASTTVATAAQTSGVSEPAPAPVVRGSAAGATIVGDSNGVTIVRAGDRQRPVLSGGIFRPQQ